jgi:threonine/homoserine/homoserine lactone efflux protein
LEFPAKNFAQKGFNTNYWAKVSAFAIQLRSFAAMMSVMEDTTLLLFSATVLPLICTPGPDMLFVASQALSGGASAGLRSTAGVCIGYTVHSALVSLGLATAIAAAPALFEALRWLGVAYLVYIALRLIKSSMRAGKIALTAEASKNEFQRGFLTAVLNPKGMMIYFAILPQFMHPGGNAALQASILSVIFIGFCAVIYTILSFVVAAVGRRGEFQDRHRRWVEGIAGGLLIAAAGKLAAS